jgi:hypothetical protein
VVVTVNTNPVNIKTESCTVDIKAPVVSIPANKAAETAINGVLGKLSDSPCSEGGVDIQSAFEVTANADGLLSILVTGSEFFQGAAHPNATFDTFNFDVKNGGKQLKLSDALTADGVQKELAACIIHDPAAEGFDPGAPATEGGLGAPSTEGGIAEDDCKFSLMPQSEGLTFDPAWVARPTGLEIEAETNHAAGDFFGSLVAWKDLQPGGVTPNTVVDDFAKAQK